MGVRMNKTKQNIEFTIYGEIVAQGRPRAGKTFGGQTRIYDPEKSRTFKQYVKLAASDHRPPVLLSEALKVEIDVYRPIPKSMPKYKRTGIEDGSVRPLVKPDVDNLAKGIKDALSGVIWEDDKQVVELQVRKWYGEPRADIKVQEL